MAASRRSLCVAGLAAGAALPLSACVTVGAPTPGVDCVGLPPGRCPGAALDAQQHVVPGRPVIVSIRIRAVNPPCTEQACQGETLVTFADGTTSSSTWSWQGPLGTPPTPTGPLPTRPPNGVVVPECRGVPAAKCAELAILSRPAGATPDPTVVRIEVTCTKLPCTDQLGIGTTVFTHEDGRREMSGWSYTGGGPAASP